jgi:hypothetical protein
MSSIASGAAALAARPLTSSELAQARLYLQQTRNGVIGAIKGLSDAQWNYKPALDSWSIAEIVEHIVTVLDRVTGPIREQLAAAPAGPEGYDVRQVDSIVLHQFAVRLQKFPAPEYVRPSGCLPQCEAHEGLATGYARLAEYLESTPDLRQHALPAAPLKAVSQGAYEFLDGYQWILAAAAHTERHTKQILEVKADGNFPDA